MRIAAKILLASVLLVALGQAAMADTTQSAAQIRVVAYSPLLRTEIVGVIGRTDHDHVSAGRKRLPCRANRQTQ